MRDTTKTLLSSIIDYAGLFPPARLDLQTAMTTYVQHQIGTNCWMLGRFILPISQLVQLVDFTSFFSLKQWALSLIISKNVEEDVKQASVFKHNSIVIKSLEFPLLSISEIDRIDFSLLTKFELFFEVPYNQEMTSCLKVLKELKHDNVFAKIRTGGLTPDAFPDVDRLSQFITTCARINLPFKATAGLHHPLRSKHPVTYGPDSDTATMHGFLNVAIGAAFLYQQKIMPEQLPFLLQETSIRSLQFYDDRIVWQNENRSYELTLAEIRSARQHFFRSFGSCSIAEPVHDLKNLNLL